MNEKASISDSNDGKLSPVIIVRASPPSSNVSLSSPTSTTLSLEFTLRSTWPVTIFNYQEILSPSRNDPLFMHKDFSFIDTVTGERYRPPVIDVCSIPIHHHYDLSYTNAHNFVNLFPNTPYFVDRVLRPRPNDYYSNSSQYSMQPGHSYRMQLRDSAKKQYVWWKWGRKWQILSWQWWPFGDMENIEDYVSRAEADKDLPPVEFVWEGDCVVHVTD